MVYFLQFLQWFSTTAVLAAVAAMAVPVWRDVIVKWIAGRIQIDVDSRIEKLRSELRNAEETFKSEIRANERRVNSAVDVALAALSGRQSAVTARQLLAVDRLWAHKAKLDNAKPAAKYMEIIDFDAAAKASGTQSNVKEMFALIDSTMLAGFNKHAEGNQLPSLASERPFLSPLVWALYKAYSAVLWRGVVNIKFLAAGVGDPKLLTSKPTDDLLKAALPELAAYVDKYSVSGYPALIEMLESRLLAATQEMLAGKEADAASLELAQTILRAAERTKSQEVSAEIPESVKAKAPPPDPK